MQRSGRGRVGAITAGGRAAAFFRSLDVVGVAVLQARHNGNGGGGSSSSIGISISNRRARAAGVRWWRLDPKPTYPSHTHTHTTVHHQYPPWAPCSCLARWNGVPAEQATRRGFVPRAQTPQPIGAVVQRGSRQTTQAANGRGAAGSRMTLVGNEAVRARGRARAAACPLPKDQGKLTEVQHVARLGTQQRAFVRSIYAAAWCGVVRRGVALPRGGRRACGCC